MFQKSLTVPLGGTMTSGKKKKKKKKKKGSSKKGDMSSYADISLSPSMRNQSPSISKKVSFHEGRGISGGKSEKSGPEDDKNSLQNRLPVDLVEEVDKLVKS